MVLAGGLLYTRDSNNLQYVTASSMVLLIYSKTIAAAQIEGVQCGSAHFSTSQIRAFAKSQVNIISGCLNLNLNTRIKIINFFCYWVLRGEGFNRWTTYWVTTPRRCHTCWVMEANIQSNYTIEGRPFLRYMLCRIRWVAAKGIQVGILPPNPIQIPMRVPLWGGPILVINSVI